MMEQNTAPIIRTWNICLRTEATPTQLDTPPQPDIACGFMSAPTSFDTGVWNTNHGIHAFTSPNVTLFLSQHGAIHPYPQFGEFRPCALKQSDGDDISIAKGPWIRQALAQELTFIIIDRPTSIENFCDMSSDEHVASNISSFGAMRHSQWSHKMPSAPPIGIPKPRCVQST